MSFAVASGLYPQTRSTALEESIMTATYTFDVFSSLDGYGSHSGDWGGYWGKQGPELLDHRLALYGEEQRMVFGANLSGVRADAGLEHGGVRGEGCMGHPDEEHAGNGGVDHTGRTPRLAGRDRRER